MNGAHDLGGTMGFGPIAPEANEPVFHAEWERRAFALTIAMGLHGRWNIDMSRYARENRDPRDYLGSSYYELWLKGLETVLVQTGLASAGELATGRPEGPPSGVTPPDPKTVAPLLARGFPANLPADIPARFGVGDRVRVRDMTTPGHTRAPRYCRGRVGQVVMDHGVFIFPDTHAHGAGQKPQHLYSVRFAGRDLWGDFASPRDAVHVDLWDDYLDAAL